VIAAKISSSYLTCLDESALNIIETPFSQTKHSFFSSFSDINNIFLSTGDPQATARSIIERNNYAIRE